MTRQRTQSSMKIRWSSATETRSLILLAPQVNRHLSLSSLDREDKFQILAPCCTRNRINNQPPPCASLSNTRATIDTAIIISLINVFSAAIRPASLQINGSHERDKTTRALMAAPKMRYLKSRFWLWIGGTFANQSLDFTLEGRWSVISFYSEIRRNVRWNRAYPMKSIRLGIDVRSKIPRAKFDNHQSGRLTGSFPVYW